MACPKCHCKTTYPYCRDDDIGCVVEYVERDRCAACGHVFYVEEHEPEHEPEDDDER